MPIWTELRDLVLGAVLGLLCDGYIRVVVYGTTVEFEEVLRWILLVPCLLVMRGLARKLLDDLGLWRLRTIVIGDNGAIASMRAAFLSEPRLGYEVVASIDLKAAAVAHTHGLGSRLLEQHRAEFAVIAVGGETRGEAGGIAKDLSRDRVPFALVPTFDGMQMSGPSHNRVLGRFRLN